MAQFVMHRITSVVYYTSLYSIDHLDSEKALYFVDALSFPILTPKQQDTLNAPISAPYCPILGHAIPPSFHYQIPLSSIGALDSDTSFHLSIELLSRHIINHPHLQAFHCTLHTL